MAQSVGLHTVGYNRLVGWQGVPAQMLHVLESIKAFQMAVHIVFGMFGVKVLEGLLRGSWVNKNTNKMFKHHNMNKPFREAHDKTKAVNQIASRIVTSMF